LLVAVRVILVGLAAANTRAAKLHWVVGSTHALVWIILATAVLGWLLGITTSVVVRYRTRKRSIRLAAAPAARFGESRSLRESSRACSLLSGQPRTSITAAAYDSSESFTKRER
jgi:uncharacterized integral membrane protein